MMKLLKRFKLWCDYRHDVRYIMRQAVTQTRQGRRKKERDLQKALRAHRRAVWELNRC